MPILTHSSYPQPPFFLINGHWETLYPGIFRKVWGVSYKRERLILSDGDFVDLDWIKNGNEKLVLLLHGLEGNSSRHYMKGMAKLFSSKGFDVVAMNCRSCSGEMNKKLRMYHHGEIEDIGEVINHALTNNQYKEMNLIGFSMGGSIIMKYLGVNAGKHSNTIKKAVAISSPCNLHDSVDLLDDPKASFYKNYFQKMLWAKMLEKDKLHPGKLRLSKIKDVKRWRDFDEAFSAPLNGFSSADEFYTQASSIHFMEDIQIPLLLLNAKNDPILPPSCYPTALAESHPYIYLEMPEWGGHVGYSRVGKSFSWSELRAMEFISS